MAKDDRFIKAYSQGKMTITEIWVDAVTGVNYLYHSASPGAGLTPLLDKDGKVVVSAPDQIRFLTEK